MQPPAVDARIAETRLQSVTACSVHLPLTPNPLRGAAAGWRGTVAHAQPLGLGGFGVLARANHLRNGPSMSTECRDYLSIIVAICV